MKNYKIVTLLLGMTIFLAFSSCNKLKYEEDSRSYMKSAFKRAQGDWEITKYEVNGIDSLALRDFPVTQFSFRGNHDDNALLASGDTYQGGGKWFIENDQEHLKAGFGALSEIRMDSPFTYFSKTSNSGYGSLWKILKLDKNEFFLINDAGKDELLTIRIEMAKMK